MNKRNKSAAFGAAVLAFSIALSACNQKTAEQPDDSSAPDVATVETTPTTLARSTSPEGASVHFVTPSNGATVNNPIRIEFGIKGMVVVKAGENRPDSGHHHLLIDTSLPNLAYPIPADTQHKHFGDGSTATEITLEPGEHTLQMLLGDYLHIPHDPPVVSEPITITVE